MKYFHLHFAVSLLCTPLLCLMLFRHISNVVNMSSNVSAIYVDFCKASFAWDDSHVWMYKPDYVIWMYKPETYVFVIRTRRCGSDITQNVFLLVLCCFQTTVTQIVNDFEENQNVTQADRTFCFSHRVTDRNWHYNPPPSVKLTSSKWWFTLT